MKPDETRRTRTPPHEACDGEQSLAVGTIQYRVSVLEPSFIPFPPHLPYSLIPHRTCWVDDVCVGDQSSLAYAIAALVDLTSRRTCTNAKTENVCLRDRPSGRKLDNRDPTQCTPHLKHEAAG